MENRKRTIRIGVDSNRALDVLSSSVFAGPEESIRELITNAADSITQLPAHLKANVEIRLVPRPLPGSDGPGILEVTDTGLGMTAEEAENYLGRIFASSKVGAHEVIGQFGVGFYACFRLCSRVEVFTRSYAEPDGGTRITYAGGDALQIEPWSMERFGTTVALHLLPENRSLLEREALERLVRRYCNFVDYPIYVEKYGHDMLNERVAPWDRSVTREDDLARDLRRLFGGETPLAMFPVPGSSDLSLPLQGVLFVPSDGETPSLRVYSHRVLITERDQALLSKSMQTFIGGAINVDNLRLVMSRDSILEDALGTRAVNRQLVTLVSDGLSSFAKSRREDFRRLMSVHGSLIKAACLEHDELFEKLADELPFRSTSRPYITIPDYLRDSHEGTVVYAENLTAMSGLLPLYEKAGLEVLFMTDGVDCALRNNWPMRAYPLKFRPAEASPPTVAARDSEDKNGTLSAVTTEVIRELFRSVTSEPLQVKVQSLGENAPPAMLALGEEERKKIGFYHYVQQLKQENRLDELPPELQEFAKSDSLELMFRHTEQNLILNQSNEMVRRLAGMCQEAHQATDRWISDLVPLLVRFLHGQALLASGLPLTDRKRMDISRSQTALINVLLGHVNKSN